jgi:hypothetical protein
MDFKVRNGIVVNEGVKTKEPVLSNEVKAAIAAANGPQAVA